MGNEIVMIGVGILSFLSLFLFFSTKPGKEEDEKEGVNKVDKYLLLFFRVVCFAVFIFSLVLLGKIGIDERDYCEVMPMNYTTSGSTTSIEYNRVCITNESASPDQFYELVTWFMRIVVIFFSVSIIWFWFKKFLEWFARVR